MKTPLWNRKAAVGDGIARARAPGRPKPGSALSEGRALYSATGVQT
jgi:hypothetical protein